jgi:hypothetical protein
MTPWPLTTTDLGYVQVGGEDRVESDGTHVHEDTGDGIDIPRNKLCGHIRDGTTASLRWPHTP